MEEEADDKDKKEQNEEADNKDNQETNIDKEIAEKDEDKGKMPPRVGSNIFPLPNMELNNDSYNKVSHLISLVKIDPLLSQQNIILSSQDFFNFQKGSLLQHSITLCNWFQAIDNDLVKNNHITNLILLVQNKSKCITSYVMRIGSH
jgi:hypothetical protein